VDETDKKARDAFFMEMDKLLKPSLSAQTGSEKTSETKVVAEQDQSHQETKSAGVRDALIAKLKQELGLKDEDVFLEKLADGDLQKLDERIQSSDAVAGERKELSMKCANCYVDMARLFHDGGQYERAADALKIAIATDPQNAVAHCNMGEIYKHLRLFDDAIQELNEAKRLNPDLPDTYINMGIIYDDHLGDDKKALEYYQKYLELGGTDKQALEWIKSIEKGL
jgi:tetratricopeptide (TPR) repeat protein